MDAGESDRKYLADFIVYFNVLFQPLPDLCIITMTYLLVKERRAGSWIGCIY